jgi:hypothetical protein
MSDALRIVKIDGTYRYISVIDIPRESEPEILKLCISLSLLAPSTHLIYVPSRSQTQTVDALALS